MIIARHKNVHGAQRAVDEVALAVISDMKVDAKDTDIESLTLKAYYEMVNRIEADVRSNAEDEKDNFYFVKTSKDDDLVVSIVRGDMIDQMIFRYVYMLLSMNKIKNLIQKKLSKNGE